MSRYHKDGAYHVWFESLTEMEKDMPPMIAQRNSALWQLTVMERSSGHSWFGCKSATEAMRLCSEGWPELLQQLQPMVAKLRQRISIGTAACVQIEVRRRKRHRGDYGDTLDMHRVWSGQLDTAWERPVKVPRLSQSQRYATVFVDCSTSSMHTAQDTLWRSAAALMMVDSLTSMGVNTEVWCGATGHRVWEGRPERFFSGVRVKEYTQPINEDRLVAMLSAAFYRTWIFGTYMAAPWKTVSSLGGILNHGLVKPLLDRQLAGERVFRMGRCLCIEDAEKEVRRALEALSAAKGAA